MCPTMLTVPPCCRRYIHDDPGLVPLLDMLRQSGKKIFLATNSLVGRPGGCARAPQAATCMQQDAAHRLPHRDHAHRPKQLLCPARPNCLPRSGTTRTW